MIVFFFFSEKKISQVERMYNDRILPMLGLFFLNVAKVLKKTQLTVDI